MDLLILAILAGICPDWWPRPRWPWPWPWPWPGPIRQPEPIPGDPIPIPDPPRPYWPLLSGIVCGAGGGLAWLGLGAEFGRDGALLAPIAIGFLGGTAAGWALDSVRSLTKSR